MARLCFILASLSPFVLLLGWFVLSYDTSQKIFSPHNWPAVAVMSLSPLLVIAAGIIGIKSVLDGSRKDTGWLAAGLVAAYCWFHIALAAAVILASHG